MTPEQRANAIYRLAHQREQYPELAVKSVEARVRLASAIIEWDTLEDYKVLDPSINTLNAQMLVSTLSSEYAQALADLVRGEL